MSDEIADPQGTITILGIACSLCGEESAALHMDLRDGEKKHVCPDCLWEGISHSVRLKRELERMTDESKPETIPNSRQP